MRASRPVASDESAFAPLRVGRFRSLWTASLFSNIGSFFQVTAGSWLMWEMTASPAWVGWMAASRNLPLLFVALPAGVLADRVDRSTVLVVTQVMMGISAVAMAVVTFFGWMTPGLLLALGILLGTAGAFNAPAWHALVPDLVPRALVTSAVALNSVSFNVARAVGPAMAGVVVATLGAAFAFGLNAISYLGMIVVLFLVGRELADQAHDRSSVVRAIVSGVRFARHTKAFRRLLVLGALFALGSAVLQAMLPVLTEELGRDVGTYGLLLGVFGVGAALGGVTLRRVTRGLGRHAISWTIVLYGVVAALAGIAPTVWLVLLPLTLSGAFWVWTVATINGTVQMLSPDWVRGRAASLWLLAYAGMVPVGSVLAGTVAERIGAGQTIFLLSLATIVLGTGARFWGIQDPSNVRSPEFTPRPLHDHPPATGGPVLISNTWHVAADDAAEFVAAMRRVRVVRLRTGGYRWQLLYEVGDPSTFNEVFLVKSWEEHLLQHRRIDDASAEIIGTARRLDVSDTGPIARHFMAIDVNTEPDVARWMTGEGDHRVMHAVDGSIPLEDAD